METRIILYLGTAMPNHIPTFAAFYERRDISPKWTLFVSAFPRMKNYFHATNYLEWKILACVWHREINSFSQYPWARPPLSLLQTKSAPVVIVRISLDLEDPASDWGMNLTWLGWSDMISKNWEIRLGTWVQSGKQCLKSSCLFFPLCLGEGERNQVEKKPSESEIQRETNV